MSMAIPTTITTQTVLVCVWKEFAQTPASTSSHAHLAGRVKVASASIRVLTTQPVLVMDRPVTMVSVKRAVRRRAVCQVSALSIRPVHQALASLPSAQDVPGL
ncbi:hypothetical protein EB796_001154 [Bugula neritina]|uniref:Uncharacterized protein n=1 Tax=Bugula neritina TaxID=10212 RepID=A0A7J7KQS8_BUGNE|nr:hypothetical protein EB796_001154 [Bugula neritina]